jgi:hypothetical protein
LSGQPDRKSIEVRYVLGELSPTEEADFEERYFGDDEAFEELQIAEEELIDAYVRGELSAAEHALLASQIARSPRLYERAEFANTMAEVISRQFSLADSVQRQPPAPTVVPAFSKEISWRDFVKIPFQKRPAFSRVLAASAALVLFAGIAVIVQSIALRGERQRLENDRAATQQRQRELDHLNEEQRLRLAQLAAELKDEQDKSARAQQLLEELRQSQKNGESGPPRTPAFASLTLFPGLIRGDGGQVLKISPGVSRVQLQIVIENADHPRYEVVVKRAEGAEVFRQGGLKAQKAGSDSSLIVQIPTTRLPPGDYLVAVSGAISSTAYEHVRNYSFRVPAQTK